MTKNITIAITALTFLWVGLLCGISFLEAPLKFQAPGITLELGLGIGKLVFGALTKIEMAISLLIIAGLVILKPLKKEYLFYLVAIGIVAIDNAILMPILDARIDMITSGNTPSESSTHWWYVGLEAVKLFSLIAAGIIFLKSRIRNN